MSFLDRLSESVSTGMESASNSAKRMAEIIKLRSEISKDKAEMKELYIEIGRLVKSELMDKIDHDDVTRLSDEIDSLMLRIKDKKEKIGELKGTKPCLKCGERINKNILCYPNCGAKQNFDVEADVDTDTDDSAKNAESIIDELEKPAILCPSCGSKEQAGIEYCSKCGSKIE